MPRSTDSPAESSDLAIGRHATAELRIQGPASAVSKTLRQLLRDSPHCDVLVRSNLEYPRRLAIRLSDGVVRVIDPQDLLWIEAANQYCQIHLKSRSFLVRKSLRNIAQSLDPEHFLRVHRSAIVNLQKITEIHTLSAKLRQVVLEGGCRVPVSQRAWECLETTLFGTA
jgi:two-component system LytT family response regulator